MKSSSSSSSLQLLWLSGVMTGWGSCAPARVSAQMSCGYHLTRPERRDVMAASTCPKTGRIETPRGRTAVPRSAHVCSWGLLLLPPPLPWGPQIGAKTAGCIPNPSLPAGWLRTGKAPDPVSKPGCRCMLRPPSPHNSHQSKEAPGMAVVFWQLISRGADLDWQQLAGSIMRRGCLPLPICQRVIIGACVLYI